METSVPVVETQVSPAALVATVEKVIEEPEPEVEPAVADAPEPVMEVHGKSQAPVVAAAAIEEKEDEEPEREVEEVDVDAPESAPVLNRTFLPLSHLLPLKRRRSESQKAK